MVEVQAMCKPNEVTYCTQLGSHFTIRILQKYSLYDEIHLVFDRYDLPNSLKTATRVRRQGGIPQVFYLITDTTNIVKLLMKKRLSHTQTKKELSVYFAQKLLEAAKKTKDVIVAYGNRCQGTLHDMSHLNSEQEEADTKLLLHAVDAKTSGATSIHIYSQYTYVFILSLHRYSELCEDT